MGLVLFLTKWDTRMKTVMISDFNTRCISILKEAQRKDEPVLITWRGNPLARIEPVYDDPPPRKFGALRQRMRIKGDIVSADCDREWESSI